MEEVEQQSKEMLKKQFEETAIIKVNMKVRNGEQPLDENLTSSLPPLLQINC